MATVLHALPPNAAILSYWDASTPLWHGKYVLGLRPDVLVVDDTNIVYDGWGTREARMASLICERPVFVLRLDPRDLQTLSTDYTLSRFLTVRVAIGGPSAATHTRRVPGRAEGPGDLPRLTAGMAACPAAGVVSALGVGCKAFVTASPGVGLRLWAPPVTPDGPYGGMS